VSSRCFLWRLADITDKNNVMKQITLYVYQSIDGCPARADKQVDDAIGKADYLLLDEETYLDVFMNHLGWPITEKETFVVAQADCNLTEKRSVKFITGDAVAEIGRMKAAGDGVIVAYGEGIAAMLLNSGLADEIVAITLPKVAGGKEKALSGIKADNAEWVVRSCRLLDSEKVRTVYGRV
jgi:hypothetical protein